MSFPPSFLDELRARLALSSVIGRRVRLQRRGREHLGLCPFHNEKTPSFTVNDDKAFFHCFGCGAHGDVIGFVMRVEGVSFPEAVERCAQEAGLAVPVASPEERAKAERHATLHAALEAAAAWFERQLHGPEGRAGLAYLQGRGLGHETVARFRLGFAPDSRGALKSALIGQGLPEPLLVEAGLLIRNETGDPTYDRFRGRVMFPISDRRGRIIAFGGRILGDGEPKYLNSPETPLFHKGRTLYGLAQARKSAQDKGEVVVAEGYMDVIAMSQGGFTNAVAPLGTALTEDHLRELWRLAPEPILCFDGDAAGQRAAARAAERALPVLAPGFSLRFAVLPAGLDPDDLIRSEGPRRLAEILAAAQPLVDTVWALEAAGRRLDTPERRAGFRAALRARVEAIAEPAVRRDYAAEMDRRLETLFGGGRDRSEGRRRGPWRPGPATIGGEAARRGVAGLVRRQQEILLATLINHPELLAECVEEAARLRFPDQLDKLRQALLNLSAHTPDLDSEELKRQLNSLGHGDALAHLMSEAVMRTVSFGRADAPLEVARRGWTEAVRRYRDLDERGEIELAGRSLAVNEQKWDAFRRRIAALEQAASEDADTEF